MKQSIDINAAMDKFSGKTRLRPLRNDCKRRSAARAAALLLATLAMSGCAASSPKRIALAELEEAAPATLYSPQRMLVADPRPLERLCVAVTPRIALLQVRDVNEWRLLADAAPEVGPCPDLTEGIVVGLVSWAGTPMNGVWPIELDAVRVTGGAGLVRGYFRSGTYLPDGTTRLELAQVAELKSVLAVRINDSTFFPEAEQ